MATSSITDQVVLSKEATEKLAELMKSEPEDGILRSFTKEERKEMDRKKEEALKIIYAKMDKRAGDPK